MLTRLGIWKLLRTGTSALRYSDPYKKEAPIARGFVRIINCLCSAYFRRRKMSIATAPKPASANVEGSGAGVSTVNGWKLMLSRL